MDICEIQNAISEEVFTIWKPYLNDWEAESLPWEFCGARKFTHTGGETVYYAVLYNDNTDEYNNDYELKDVFRSFDLAVKDCELRNKTL